MAVRCAEKKGLAGLIVFKIGMLIGADMIGREIGKGAGIKANTVNAGQLQCLRGDLHNDDLYAVVDHILHMLVKIVAFGRGVDRVDLL